MLGMTAVTLVAILTTGYIALWASGDSLRLQRESMTATLSAAVARSVASEWAMQPGATLAERRTSLRTLLRSLAETTDALGLSVIGLDRGEIASWPLRRQGDSDAAVVSTALAGGPPADACRAQVGRDHALAAVGLQPERGARRRRAARGSRCAPAPRAPARRRVS